MQNLQRQPFYNREEFVGNISIDKITVDKLQIVLQYATNKESQILGSVYGNKDTFNRLESIIRGTFGFDKIITSDDVTYPQMKIRTHQAIIRTASDRPVQGNQDVLRYEVANLELLDVKKTELFESKNLPKRLLSFFLCGPRSMWMVHALGQLSYTGEVKKEVYNSDIDLSEEFPFTIKVCPHYLYDASPTSEKHQLTTDVYTIQFETDKSEDELSDKDFLETATKVADDLILLVSFLSGKWIRWFRYEFQTKDMIENYIRSVEECSSREPSQFNEFIAKNEIRNFIKIGFSKLRELRDHNFDLFMPIVYYINGNEARYVDEQFAITFLALEKIKDLYTKKRGLTENESKGIFEKHRKSVSSLLKKRLNSGETYKRMRDKIPELNRPTLRLVLDSMFAEYNISWKDLYPPGSKLSFIKTRDLLFHSSEDIDPQLLMKELDRIKIIVQRLILKLIGWDKKMFYSGKWLTKSDSSI